MASDQSQSGVTMTFSPVVHSISCGWHHTFVPGESLFLNWRLFIFQLL